MKETMNPEIPYKMQRIFEEEKEQAFTLYLDFVVDGTASMYTVFPAIYYAAMHFLEALSSYEVFPKIGLTIFRNEQEGDKTEYVSFEEEGLFTGDLPAFLKKLKNVRLYGGGEDGKESVHAAVRQSLLKFPQGGRNKAMLLFSDAYGSNDEGDYRDIPMGQILFFTTDALAAEEFRFCFVRPDGTLDEEASPMFLSIEKLLKPMSADFIDNVVKPLKDLMKGVSMGA